MNVLPASIYVPTEAREGIWSPGTSFRGVLGIETRSSSWIIKGAFPSTLLTFINRVLCEFLHVKPTLHSLDFPSLIILCYICCGVGFCLLIVAPWSPDFSMPILTFCSMNFLWKFKLSWNLLLRIFTNIHRSYLLLSFFLRFLAIQSLLLYLFQKKT